MTESDFHLRRRGLHDQEQNRFPEDLQRVQSLIPKRKLINGRPEKGDPHRLGK